MPTKSAHPIWMRPAFKGPGGMEYLQAVLARVEKMRKNYYLRKRFEPDYNAFSH